MNRAEHLQWAKNRALEYVKTNDLNQAFASIMSDLGKHKDLKNSRITCAEIGVPMKMGGMLNTPKEMTDFITGFN